MTNAEMMLYDQICENEIATPEEINLAFNVSGRSWTEVLDAIVLIRTGYRTIQDMIDADCDDYEPGYDLDEGFDPYMGCYTEDC